MFGYLDLIWGPHTVDRFSSHYNNKCNRFNSKWWVPGSEAIDCLVQRWTGEVNWVVPPPALITECLQKFNRDKAVDTLVVPQWVSAPFWPLLIDETGQYSGFIKEVFPLPLKDSICIGKGYNGVFSRNPLSFRMLALKCDCS